MLETKTVSEIINHLKSKDLKIIPDYDLWYVGINYIDRKKKFEILDTTSNLYETFDWIKKISIKVDNKLI